MEHRLSKIIKNRLTKKQGAKLIQKITDLEIQQALFSMKEGTSPEPDAFTVDFFNKNWWILGAGLINSI